MTKRDGLHPPAKHLSIRVPWNDIGWDGRVCNAPNLNSSCIVLDRIAPKKFDGPNFCLSQDYIDKNTAPMLNAGSSIENLDDKHRPACMGERMGFMTPFNYDLTIKYPFAFKDKLKHFLPTVITNSPYSALTVPFFWLSKKGLKFILENNILPVSEELEECFEEDNGFTTDWVNMYENQKMIMDWFYDYIEPETSLCFFYAKKVPFVEDENRVIIGVGRIKNVDPYKEYDYAYEGEYRGIIWERNVHHSIRPEYDDGFILPYHEIIKLSEEKPELELDPSEFVVVPPKGKINEFSYVTEHVSNDTAIEVLFACKDSLEKALEYGIEGPWERSIQWINMELDELWKMRGPCPGMGSVLTASGFNLGNFIAWELSNKREEDQDPWELLQQSFKDPNIIYSRLKGELNEIKETWEYLDEDEKKLMTLLSRFDITSSQAEMFLFPDKREELKISVEDKEILENPYLISELTRYNMDPIGFLTIDHGILPEIDMRNRFSLPEESLVESDLDKRRVRALIIDLLDEASANGHALLPQNVILDKIKDLKLQPQCNLNEKNIRPKEKFLFQELSKIKMDNGKFAYQLKNIEEVETIIRNELKDKILKKRNISNIKWEKLLFDALNFEHGDVSRAIDPETEQMAREEKAAALREIAESPFSVLIGSAGTGKTTLLSILSKQDEIRDKGILLLAPTGKARVKMEQALGISSRNDPNIKAFNVAQFLIRSSRYDGETGRYLLNNEPAKRVAGTIIVDEASMLTEEMLAALLQSIRGYDRLILVGDRYQLPPIGTGRPFVDIISELKQDNLSEDVFPKVSQNYVELTQNRRQLTNDGKKREDIQLASWFRGGAVDSTEDHVYDILTGSVVSDHVKVVQWNDPAEFQKLIFETLENELMCGTDGDYRAFNDTIGAMNGMFSLGSAKMAENWQILSPVRNKVHGVSEINRMVHKKYKEQLVRTSKSKWNTGKKAKPAGSEEIVWGDKVINVKNQFLTAYNDNYEKYDGYLANGEIGILVSTQKFRNKKNKNFFRLKFEFATQPGITYSFNEDLKPIDRSFKSLRYLNDEQPSIELAYALTIHKSQGSEFGKVILVIPKNSFTLSRELIYTALTRQKEGLIILYQGDPKQLMNFSEEKWSETNQRFTNLFKPPHPHQDKDKKDLFLEDRLINRTLRGEDVRSKSELIIANILYNEGIDYEYEPILELNNEIRRPDFMIKSDSGITYYWEHLGMCQNRGYREDWKKKEKWYQKNDILPLNEGGGKNGTLITTLDTKKGGIDSSKIKKLVDIIGN